MPEHQNAQATSDQAVATMKLPQDRKQRKQRRFSLTPRGAIQLRGDRQ